MTLNEQRQANYKEILDTIATMEYPGQRDPEFCAELYREMLEQAAKMLTDVACTREDILLKLAMMCPKFEA